MINYSKDIVIRKITEMSKDQVSKVLIFMAGMEAEHAILERNNIQLCEVSESSTDSHVFLHIK